MIDYCNSDKTNVIHDSVDDGCSMYRVVATCQGGHIVACGCHLAWYLIYEGRSRKPDDRFDSFAVGLPSDQVRLPEDMIVSIFVRQEI